MAQANAVRVRMAPSPTGNFHVGSARTALFNYLFARHCDGVFVLRIEDTDVQRNEPRFEQVIYDAMAWLGLDPDEGPSQGGEYGPYRQSERFATYTDYARQLVASGAAYPAYETADELAAMKAEQQARKLPPRYNGAHRALTGEQRQDFENKGRKPVLRFRVPEGDTAWEDLVRGRTGWKNGEIDDFVIMKSDDSPTYNFACAIDDALMQISHVIRGEDGLSNTPRQLLVYRALGFEPPRFAHLPFLLGADRSKLSKRHGAVNLLDFRDQGVLPEAMFNYLALLGWNPGEGETQEIFSPAELIDVFRLENVNKAGAIFDNQKLQWVNTHHLKTMPLEQFVALAGAYLKPYQQEMQRDPAYTQKAVELARERIHALPDIAAGAAYFLSDTFATDEAGAAKHLTDLARPRIALLTQRLEDLPNWDHDSIETAIRSTAEELGCKPAELIHPARLLVSGRPVGPSLFELLSVLGRQRVLARLKRW